MFFCVVALALMGFVVLYRFSVLADLNSAMNRMNEEYNALRNENRLLKVEIETSIDLDKVKQVAETEMGMHKPDRFQIIPVSVPKNDYNVVLDQQYIDQATKNNQKPFLKGMLDAIQAAFRRTAASKLPGLAGLSHGNTNISFRSGIYFIQNQFRDHGLIIKRIADQSVVLFCRVTR